MLDVVTETRCDGEALAESSHDAWVATTPPSQAPGPPPKGTWRWARASHDDTGSPRLLLTGGGIGHSIPRKPRARVLSLADRTVRIELPPPPTDCHAFRRQCEEVSVLGESSAGTAEMELARCRPGPFWGSDPASPIELDLTLPEGEVWNLRWRAHLRPGGEDDEGGGGGEGTGGPVVATPLSGECRVDLTPAAAAEEAAALERWTGQARNWRAQVEGAVRAARADMAGGTTGPADRGGKTDWRLHSALSRARWAHSELTRALHAAGEGSGGRASATATATAALKALGTALEEAKPVRAEMNRFLSSKKKRDARCVFKAKITALIEDGAFAAFLAVASPKALEDMGGGHNRLYQLLVEGKGRRCGSLVLNPDVFEAAAERSDLWSYKQIAILMQRKKGAEEAIEGEIKRLSVEAEKEETIRRERTEAGERAAEHKLLVDLQRRAIREQAIRCQDEQLGFEPGAKVRIHSLQAQNADVQSLNGTNGIVTSRANVLPNMPVRYLVRCDETGKIMSMLPKNLERLDLASRLKVAEKLGVTATESVEAPTVSLPARPFVVDLAPSKKTAWSKKARQIATSPVEEEGIVLVPAPSKAYGQCLFDQQKKKASILPGAASPAREGKAPTVPCTARPFVVDLTPSKKTAWSKKARQIATSPVEEEGIVLVPAPSKERQQYICQQQKTATKTQPILASKAKRNCTGGASCRFLLPFNRCHFYHSPQEIQKAQERCPRKNQNAWKQGGWKRRSGLLSHHCVSFVIGPKGRHVKELSRDTCTHITIDQANMVRRTCAPHLMRKILITGRSKESIQRAAVMIRDLVCSVGSCHDFFLLEEDEKNDIIEDSKLKSVENRLPATSPRSLSPTEASTPSPSDVFPNVEANRPTLPMATTSDYLLKHSNAVCPNHTAHESSTSTDTSSVLGPVEISTDTQSLVSEPSSNSSFINQAHPIVTSRTSAFCGFGCGSLPSSNDVDGGNIGANIATDFVRPVLSVHLATAQDPSSQMAELHFHGEGSLLQFLRNNEKCLKGSPVEFANWLGQSEDILCLSDLADAVEDSNYLQNVLQGGDGNVGIKGFKRTAFKDAAIATSKQLAEEAASKVSSSCNEPESRAVKRTSEEIPPELICPISQDLMVDDPVIASDGHSYERTCIEAWYLRQRTEVERAIRIVRTNPENSSARAIVERGVLSPITHERVKDMNLLQNLAVRSMARDVARATGQM